MIPMNKAWLAMVSVAVCGISCGNNPVQPDWQINAFGALGGYTSAYLAGNSVVADLEFARAKYEIASTGRPDLAARADLVRCAVHGASLVLDLCTGVAANADMALAERAYAQYLGGGGQPLGANQGRASIELLPEQHRAVAAAKDPAERLAALTAVADPLARLIAASVLLQQGNLPPEGVDLAVNAASAQGWRRPLLAWLGVQLKLAERAGDAEGKARIQRRIDLALSPQ